MESFNENAVCVDFSLLTTISFQINICMKKHLLTSIQIASWAILGMCNSAYSQLISCGTDYSLLVCNSSSAMGMGNNSGGNLGNGWEGYNFSPTAVSELTNIIAIGGGNAHSLALRSDKTVWTWGAGYSGQLGNGINTASSVPIQVNSLSAIKAISAGGNANYAVQNDGTVKSWGSNAAGQLGNSAIIDSSLPVTVIGLNAITTISGGYQHALALKSDGTVFAWGLNSWGLGTYGGLGIGSSEYSVHTPVQISSLNGIIAIAAGATHSLFLKNDGTVWSTGHNFEGQLGNGANIDQNVPVQVIGLTGVTAIAAGRTVSVALKSDGTVWAWGSNAENELGNGTATDSNVPVQVSLLSDITSIACGESSSLALRNDGVAWAWGKNNYGQYGIGTFGNSDVPVQVIGLCPLIASSTSVNLISGISVFPNPSEGIIKIANDNFNQHKICDLEIITIQGIRIFKSSLTAEETTVDLSMYSPGIYLIRVSSEKEIFTQKISLN